MTKAHGIMEKTRLRLSITNLRMQNAALRLIGRHRPLFKLYCFITRPARTWEIWCLRMENRWLRLNLYGLRLAHAFKAYLKGW